MKNLTHFKRIRLEAGYSNLKELSRDCKVDHQSLFDYDHGYTIPTLRTAVRLMEFFDKKLEKEVNIYDLWGDILKKKI